MSGWRKLRPCDADLSGFVRFGCIGTGAILTVAGGWGIVNFWRNAVRGNATQFVVLAYIAIFGVLLVLGEIGRPASLYTYFGLLSSSSGRAWFLFFVATLALSSGLSEPWTAIDHILLIGSGCLGIVLTPLALCYGNSYGENGGGRESETEMREDGGGGLHLPKLRTGTARVNRANPDIAI